MSFRDCRWWVAILVLVGVGATTGCGQGEYNRRLDAAIQDAGYRSRYGVLDSQPTVWSDLPFQIRLPWTLTRPRVRNNSKYLCLRPAPGAIVVNEQRLQPSWVTLPGAIITYQGIAENGGTGSEAAYSLHLAAANIGQAADETTLDKLRDDIKAACPMDKGIAWNDVELETIDHQKLKMRHLHATGEGSISFEGYADAAALYKGPMTLDLYTTKIGDYRVFIAWWIPERLKDKVPVETIGKLTVSTLQPLF
ncbi:MAG: hypothetical protein JNM18_00035 [Planctomycetaceae bacterium]|nr:hypothetical protein [Planctomycetaceae bacterium]